MTITPSFFVSGFGGLKAIPASQPPTRRAAHRAMRRARLERRGYKIGTAFFNALFALI